MGNSGNAKEAKPVGLTKDGSWQIGVRKTVAADLSRVWQLLTSRPGLEIWLGAAPDLTSTAAFVLPGGTRCQVRVLKPESHLRMSWQPPGWQDPSTIQIRVVASGDKTVVAFHQEGMPSAAAREHRRIFYKEVMAELVAMLES